LPPPAWTEGNRRQPHGGRKPNHPMQQAPPTKMMLTLLKQADVLAERGDTTAAAAAYTHYIEASARKGERVSDAAHFNAAASYSAAGDFDRADRHYTLALGADRRNAPADRAADVAAGMAITASRRGDARESVRRWREALRHRPRDANLMFALGRELERAGDTHEAINRLREAAETQPSSPRFHFFLGLLTAKHNGAEAAQPHFARAIALPADAAAMHELALEIADDHPQHALEFFAAAADRTKSRMHARAIVYAWGRTLADLGKEREERALYDDAARGGVLADARQRPLLLDAALLPATPWPSRGTLDALRPAIELLERNAAAISNEWLAVSNQRNDATQADSEALVAAGGGAWRQGVLRRNGVWFPTAKAQWPVASRVVERVEALTGDVNEDPWMPKAAAEFSAIAPGSKLTRHCGPSNHRLRLHLGLQIPSTGAAIEVAGEARGWDEGKVLVIDDSFEHKVHTFDCSDCFSTHVHP
jgi:Tfp pilus assembly protein PilF